MKKIVSILLIAVMLLSFMSITAFAKTTISSEVESYLDEVSSVSYYEKEIEYPEWNESEKYLYKDKFLKAYNITDSYTIAELTYEEEEYFDIDADGVIDYVLIYAHLPEAHESFHFVDLGTHFIEQTCYYYPFGPGYALYDIKEDDYFPYTMYMMKKYPFMADYQKEHPKGIPYGDADMDYRLSVLDATEIQCGLAGLTKNGKWNWIIDNSGGVYRSDIDRDGTITIMDATTIQVQLAGLDKEPVENTEMVIKYLKDIEDPVLDVIPDEGRIEYEPVLGGRDVYVDVSSGRSNYIAIVKSEAHFEELFGCTDEKYNDEFFETKALVVALSHSNTAGFYTKVYGISVIENKLYLCLVSEYENSGWVGVPDDTMYHNFVAVDKKDVASVTDMCYVRYPFV